MPDWGKERQRHITESARRFVSVSPSDSTDLADVPRGISVNVDGNVSMDSADGTETAVVIRLLAGQIYPLAPKRIRSTSTTATGIVAYY